MKLGAHVSIAGGISRAVERGVEIGAECLQIFASSPRTWQSPEHPEPEVARFRERLAETGMAPVFVHSIYLLNLASPDDGLRRRSITSLANDMCWAERLGAQGVITHLGSALGGSDELAEETVADSLATTLAHSPDGVRLLLETAAGRTIGRNFAQLGRLIRRLDGESRLSICLDTAHVFAAGYDFGSAPALRALLAEFEREIGLARLLVVHANDSKAPLGSGRDRHENIGRGYIGEKAFRLLLRHPALRDLPFVIEVPGFAQTGPDRENLTILRRLMAGRNARR